MTFTTSNWSTAQTVTVNESEDEIRLDLDDDPAGIILILPDRYMDDHLTFDTSPQTAIAPPAGIEFSLMLDISLDAPLDDGESATVCLPTTGVPDGRMPVLYHLPDLTAAWDEIGRNTATYTGFVCGTTTTFSEFAVGYETVSGTARLNKQILSRVSQAITAGTLAAVGGRVEAAARFDGVGGFGGAGISGNAIAPAMAYQFGGQSSLHGLFQAHGQAMLQDEMDYARLLDGASFVIPLSATRDRSTGKVEGNSDKKPDKKPDSKPDKKSGNHPGRLSLWGGSDYRSLGSDEDSLNWDGEILSTHLGIDGRVSEKVLAGVALSWNRADFDFRDKAGDENSSGDYQYRSTNLHPYFGWLPSDNLKVWASAGIGQGEIEIEVDGNAARSTDTAQWSLGGGFNHRLLGWSGQSDAKGLRAGRSTTLHFKGDIALTQVAVEAAADARFAEQDIGSQRVRLLLSGEQRRELASGGVAMPSLEVGVRVDGGDGERASGLEIGTGLRYVNPDGRLAVSGNVRGLLSDKYDEFGADVMFQLSPSGGRGLSLSVNPVLGKTQSVAERLWDDGVNEVVGELGDGDGELQSSLAAEVGYGVAATMLGSPGLLTPYLGMTADEVGIERLRLGGRFAGGNGLSLNLEGTQNNTADGVNHTVLLRGELAF